jgi:hypothetical protein
MKDLENRTAYLCRLVGPGLSSPGSWALYWGHCLPRSHQGWGVSVPQGHSRMQWEVVVGLEIVSLLILQVLGLTNYSRNIYNLLHFTLPFYFQDQIIMIFGGRKVSAPFYQWGNSQSSKRLDVRLFPVIPLQPSREESRGEKSKGEERRGEERARHPRSPRNFQNCVPVQLLLRSAMCPGLS